MFEPTDEMVETASRAAADAYKREHPSALAWDDTDDLVRGSFRSSIREGISAVAPAIRAQAFREAGTVAFAVVEQSNYAKEQDDDQWQDGWIVGASDQAEGARDAILALAEKETTR